MWVFDATPLIYLAKAERLGLVGSLDEPRLVPHRVYDEVVTVGLERSYPDARRFDRRIEDGMFEIVSVEPWPLFDHLEGASGLSMADITVLELARRRNAVAVLDDGYGREVAATEGISTRGTAFVVLSLAADGRISTDEARETIDAMVDEGWYCAPDLYAKIVRKIETFE